jgi:hypothetical protein
MTICLIPASSRPYDVKIMKDFASGLNQLGRKALHLTKQLPDNKLDKFALNNSISVFVRINAFPPEGIRLSGFKHISWFQDVFPSTNLQEHHFKDGDLVVTLGSKTTLGLKIPEKFYAGSMVPYIDPYEFEHSIVPCSPKYDFNLVGFIPRIFLPHPIYSDVSPANFSSIILPLLGSYYSVLVSKLKQKDISFLSRKRLSKEVAKIKTISKLVGKDKSNKIDIEEKELLDACYKHHSLVSGMLKIEEFEKNIRSEIPRQLNNDAMFDFFVRETPRYFDRVFICKELLNISNNLIIAGENWKYIDAFRNYAIGHISFEHSLDLFRSSKITLINNNHGIGLQPRTLACMASGGFIFSHSSARGREHGGLRSIFEPNLHFGEFNADNIQQEARFWLENNEKRIKVAAEGRKKVLSDMTWNIGAKHFIKQCQL